MRLLINKFTKFCEGVSAIMLAGIFITFLIQIFARYILTEPFGWTLEVCLTLWVWLIFWSNSFVIKQNEHVTFDIVYYAVREKLRKTFALIGALFVIGALIISVYPTWDFIDFLKIKRSTSLQIPMRTIFMVYMIFLIANIVIFSTIIIRIMRFGLNNYPPHMIPAGNIKERFEETAKNTSFTDKPNKEES